MKTIELQLFILFYKCQGQCPVNAPVTNDKGNKFSIKKTYSFSLPTVVTVHWKMGRIFPSNLLKQLSQREAWTIFLSDGVFVTTFVTTREQFFHVLHLTLFHCLVVHKAYLNSWNTKNYSTLVRIVEVLLWIMCFTSAFYGHFYFIGWNILVLTPSFWSFLPS